MMTGSAYGFAVAALRFFNVYGPRQALSNPYTGVLAIFAGRLLNDAAPLVYEDGRQQRDFVHVRDVACCCRLALESSRADGAMPSAAGSPSPAPEIVAATCIAWSESPAPSASVVRPARSRCVSRALPWSHAATSTPAPVRS